MVFSSVEYPTFYPLPLPPPHFFVWLFLLRSISYRYGLPLCEGHITRRPFTLAQFTREVEKEVNPRATKIQIDCVNLCVGG